MRENKGITLIALVITIIIMLILAGVSIGLVFNGGLIDYARTAKTNTQEQIANEQLLANGIVNGKTIDEWVNGENSEKTLSDYAEGLEIGDTVDYDEGTGYTWTADTTKGVGVGIGGSWTDRTLLAGDAYETEDLEWKVLGINSNGQIELISSTPTTSELYIGRQEGYDNGVNELNNYCNILYGQGDFAVGARSITVEDINKLTDFNPEKDAEGYGLTWKYKKDTEETEYIQSLAPGEEIWFYGSDMGTTTFIYNGEPIADGANPIELRNTYYNYELNNSLVWTGTGFWLASTFVGCNSRYVDFGLRGMDPAGNVVDVYSLCVSNGYAIVNGFAVRPVVTLESDIHLTGSSQDGWSIQVN